MNSLILQIAARYLKALFLIFALLALFRGHNQPGGGFIGGLLAALSIVYSSLAYTALEIKNKLKMKPEYYIALGLICMLTSTVPGIITGNSVMKGVWLKLEIPMLLTLKLGTPLLFDIGVFLTVIGVTLLFFFTLSTKE
jgi:multicomponent Na+:H+ antiporter subunit B